MATSWLLVGVVANPLNSRKQIYPITFSGLRSLPTTASFKTQHLSSSSSSPKYDLKLKCSSDKNHFTSSDHASRSEANPTGDSLDTIANEIFSNVLKGLKNPKPLEAIFNETVWTALKLLKTPAMAAVLLGLLLTCHPKSAAWAASGGCVGGSSFSKSSSKSSSSSYSSYSSSPSYYSYPSSRSYRSYSYSVPRTEAEEEALEYMVSVIYRLLILIGGLWCLVADIQSSAAATSNVVKLQVGLLGTARALQIDLDRIAETADTSNRKGLSYVLTEATVALLRHPDCWISSYSSVTTTRNMEDAEKCFNKISIEERAKFDEETLFNLNNKRRKSSTSKTHDGIRNEYVVVTLLVAIEGKHKVPTINSSDDLKKALKNLGSIPSKNIAAVQVLWTPQQKDDTLSEEELIEDYPLLKRF